MATEDGLPPLPPRLLKWRIRRTAAAPTLARLELLGDDGLHSFLVTREILEQLADRCREDAEKMPRSSSLS